MLVYRLSDLILDKFAPLTSIGGCILFANVRESLCVSGRALPTIAGDSIVQYTPGTKHLGNYHLQSGTWFQPTDEYILAIITGEIIILSSLVMSQKTSTAS
jgi:hypothetical protein